MGGGAFANRTPPLHVPRLSPSEYAKARLVLVRQLSALYKRVAVPFEAPEKASYGDVDIIVAGPKRRHAQPAAADIRQGSASTSSDGSGPDRDHHEKQATRDSWPVGPLAVREKLRAVDQNGISYAVPTEYLVEGGNLLGSPSYVQVDIHHVEEDMFDWFFFTQCHGDLFLLIGPSLRRLGLIITTSGFYSINPRIEPHDKKKARVFLSKEPTAVLDFLHLNPELFYGTTSSVMIKTYARNSQPTRTRVRPNTSDPLRFTFATRKDLFAYAEGVLGFYPPAYWRPAQNGQARRRMLRPDYSEFVTHYLPHRYAQLFYRYAGNTSLAEGADAPTIGALDRVSVHLAHGATDGPADEPVDRPAYGPTDMNADMPASDPANEPANRHLNKPLAPAEGAGSEAVASTAPVPEPDASEERAHTCGQALRAFGRERDWEDAEKSWFAEHYREEEARLCRRLRRDYFREAAVYAEAWVEWLRARG